MAEIGKYNEGVRQIRTRVDFSKVRAEEGVSDVKLADEKMQEAVRLMGRVGRLLIDAANLQASGAAKLTMGSNEIGNISAIAGRIFEGSDTAEEITRKVAKYKEDYDLLARMAGFTSEGLRQNNLPAASTLYDDLRNREAVMSNQVASSMARIGEARQLDRDLRGRFA